MHFEIGDDVRYLESRQMVQAALNDAMDWYEESEPRHSLDRWRDMDYDHLFGELRDHVEEARGVPLGKRAYELRNVLVLAAICLAKAANPHAS
jgi:hypothetical protein